MATVSYTGALAVNPSLDEVLDPSGTIITQTDTIFEIENATGGEWNGFVFRVEGSGLAYPDDLSGSFGSVTAINVFDPNASLVATVSYQTAWGGYESPSFLSFWLSLNSVGATAAKALDQLFLSPTSGHTTQGSDNSDHLTTYGQTGNVVLYGNAGDDVLLSRLSTNFATLVGGTGDDTFRFSPDSSGMPLNSINVAGSSQDGSGGEGEFNTIELIKGQYSIMSATDIDGLTFVGGGSKFLTIHANQIGNGRLSSTLAVTGDDAGEGRITIQNVNGNPVDLNLSGWTFINWNSPAPIQINLSGDLYAPTNNRVIATSLADSILGGLGHDTLDGGLGNDTIDGWQGNDSLIGGDGDDLLRDHGPGSNTLDGGAGNDRLEVNGSSDNRLSGGSGNDFLSIYSDGSNTLSGGDGDDELEAYADGNNFVDGGSGDDHIEVNGEGDNQVLGGDGHDWVRVYSDGASTLDGGAGHDFLSIEGDGSNRLIGGNGDDTLHGGYGSDILNGGVGVDELYGGEGDNTFIYAAGDAVFGEVISGGDGTSDAIRLLGNNDFSGVAIYGIERLVFEGATRATFDSSAPQGGLTVVGDNSQNEVAIALKASGYVDLGSWTFENWSSNDKISFSGSSENDDLVAPAAAIASIDGGAGYDRVKLALGATTQAWNLDLTDGTVLQTAADGTTFKNIEAIAGVLGLGNDTVTGGNGSNTGGFPDPVTGYTYDDYINLGGGHDQFNGRGGDDYVMGGAGNDTLDGGLGYDVLYGGSGNDIFYTHIDPVGWGDSINGGDGIDLAIIDRTMAISSALFNVSRPLREVSSGDGMTLVNIERLNLKTGSGNDTLRGGDFSDTLDGGFGRDEISGGGDADSLNGGAGIDIIDGGSGNDTIYGGSEADLIDGGSDNDFVYGDAGADNLDGGDGNDVLDGGSGFDILSGGLGNDTLFGAGGSDRLDGGEGDDTAVFSGNRADYTVSVTMEGLLVTHLPTKSMQVISDVEFYQFTSSTLSRAQFLASEPQVVVTPEPPVVTPPQPPVVTPPETVETTASTTLTYGSLNLVAGGTGNISLTGNSLDNSITGNRGKNTVDGGGGKDKVNGGLGNDNLIGGSGKDAFLFTTKLGTSATDRKVNFDTIRDFSTKDDSLYLDNAIFKKLGKGSESRPVKLDKKFFTVGDKAKDKDDYIVYNKKTGVLSYDADGSGKGQAVEFALLKNKPTLKYDDFFVI